MVATLKTSSRTRYGLIALLALRQARAIREREAREAAERAAASKDGAPEPRRRVWFR